MDSGTDCTFCRLYDCPTCQHCGSSPSTGSLFTSQVAFTYINSRAFHDRRAHKSHGTGKATSQNERIREKRPCHRHVPTFLRVVSSVQHANATLRVSRGIGLHFVRTLVEQQYTVWDTVRPQSNHALSAEIVRCYCMPDVARDRPIRSYTVLVQECWSLITPRNKA
jgi:hypothetical protein